MKKPIRHQQKPTMATRRETRMKLSERPYSTEERLQSAKRLVKEITQYAKKAGYSIDEG